MFPGAEPASNAGSTPNGTRYKVLREGKPQAGLQGIRADLSVWTHDGHLAFTTYGDRPAEFGLALLPDELARAATDLGIGGEAVFWLPRAALEPWRPAAFPSADVVLWLRVLEPLIVPVATTRVIKSSSTPEGVKPPSLNGAPADAARTRSGVRYVTLIRGDGQPPGPDTEVSLAVTAWTPRGIEMLPVVDNLRLTTSPARAPGGLGEVLRAGLPGGRIRVWVPADRAKAILPDYANRELVLDLAFAGAT